MKSMNQIINQLEKKTLILKQEADLMHNNFDGMKLALFQNVMKNSKRAAKGRRYSDEVKEFAVTLQFYSAKAYTYVRKILPLPHPSLIQKWARSINCEPGFLTEAFETLQQECESNNEKKDCCLVIDAMAIRKQAIWDKAKKKYTGFVDYGNGIQLEPTETLASEALTFELVGLRSHWKIPIGYFFTDKTTASVQASLIKTALTMAHQHGLKIWCITCDGTTTNLAMFENLGCSFGTSYDSIVTKFPHPSTGDDVFAILDACHMLKLARNSLAFLGSFHGLFQEKIEWKYLCHLHEVQQREGLKLANKISTEHIEFERHKMNVSLAAQTLSASVANAIEFLDKVLQMSEFEESAATVKFIKIVDRLFDTLNSRNPHGKGFKQPLKNVNIPHWENSLETTAQYLLNLKSSSGQLLITHRRKTFILGFVITIKSTIEMAKQMLTLPQDPFKYVLTYKYSQDHIELLFSCIRAKGGWNNNPNVLQFKAAVRRLVLGNAVTASKTANCKLLDDNSIIPFFHTRKNATPLAKTANEEEGNEDSSTEQHDERLDRLISQVDFQEPTELKANILTYIAGLVVKKLLKQIKCITCIESLTSGFICTNHYEHDYSQAPNQERSHMALTHFLNKGSLHIPSKLVVSIIEYAEYLFVLYVSNETFDQINISERLNVKMVLEVSRYFGQEKPELLPPYHLPAAVNEMPTEDHRLCLVKYVANTYLNLRLSSYGKIYSKAVVNFGKPSSRHHLTKTILFLNQ
jgi:hypothetical protein